jgi:UMF1 family MFS transporter
VRLWRDARAAFQNPAVETSSATRRATESERTMNDRAYRKIVNSWAMYDWANSAFMATVVAVMFPLFYGHMVTGTGRREATATAYLLYSSAIALLVAAVMSPVLGAIADHTGGRKRYLGAFLAMGVAATALFAFLGPTSFLWGSFLFILANIGFAGAEVFYESLLPHIAQRNDMDQISARGYAFGYLGGGLLLLVNALWFAKPGWFFMPSRDFAMRASFLSVAVWWAVFSIPLFRNVPEPPKVALTRETINAVSAGFQRLGQTLSRITRYRQLLLFLVAFWIYNDGIGTIIKAAVRYGEERGIEQTHLVVALLLTQFIGMPCAIAFGRLAKFAGAKRSILLGIGAYMVICVGGYYMNAPAHFYGLAIGIALVQGGTQALSRSLYGAMVPKTRTTEFFGFFSTSSKFAGLFGLVLFAVIGQWKDSFRPSILFLTIFFAVGGLLLALVKENEGIRVAREEDAAIDRAKGAR